jgi:glycosyltransferase involved in cell wall biosynthesis
VRTVLLDGYNLQIRNGTGVKTYARNLSYAARDLGFEVHILYGLRTPPSEDSLESEVAFFDAPDAPRRRVSKIRRAFEVATSPFGVRANQLKFRGAVVAASLQDAMPYHDRLWNIPGLFERARWHFDCYGRPLEVRISPSPDIVHWTYPLPIRVRGARNIYTMHDLVPLRLPYSTLDKKERYLRLSRMLAARADHIVTVSETSKRDIVNLLEIPEDRVTNTYQSVTIKDEDVNRSIDHVTNDIQSLGFNYKDYFLFYGAIEPKKNLVRLVEGYLGSGVASPLVLVGKTAWLGVAETRFLDAVTAHHVSRFDDLVVTIGRTRVRRLDYVPISILISLIKGAKAVLFPSLYEGFGLPALEAMALGTPILSSTEGAMPEILGDAAVLVDPYDPLAIGQGIRALEDGAFREALARKGHRQFMLYSGQRYRQRLDSLYARLIEN